MRRYANPTSIIDFEIQDLDGKWTKLIARKLTVNDLKKLDDFSKKVREENSDVSVFDNMLEQMVVYFGGTREDYTNYDIRILRSVIEDLSADLLNPLPKTQS